MKSLLNKIADKQGTILQIALGGIMVLFIGIMIMVYFIARQANPILLDEKGNPKTAQSSESRSY